MKSIRMHFFGKQLISHLVIGILVIILLSTFFFYYASSNIIYQNKEKELSGERAVISRVLQNDTHAEQTLALYKSLLRERDISFVLMDNKGQPVLKQLTQIMPDFRIKAVISTLKSHIKAKTANSEKIFIIDKHSSSPVMVAPRVVRFKDGRQPVYMFVLAPVQGVAEMVQGIQKAIALAGITALVLAVVISWLFSRGVSKSIAILQKATRDISMGNYEARSPVKRSDELGDLSRDFNRMAERLADTSAKLAQYDRQRRKFLADVSHELRTPLTSIRGITEALKTNLIAAGEKSKYYAIIEKETLRMIRLINELLDLEKIENGMIMLSKETYSLKELFEIVGELLEPHFSEKLLQLSTDCEEFVTVYGDYDRLIQILINIVKNSIQFSEYGTIALHGEESDKDTTIRVSDTGKGMSEDELAAIWDRFYKVDPSRSKEKGETGLGLSIVKQLIEAHGGEIHASSELGIGTTFTLILPKATEAAEEA